MQHEKFQSAPGSRVGTPAYLAPEVIMTTKGQTYDGKVSSVVTESRRAVVAANSSGGCTDCCSMLERLSASVELDLSSCIEAAGKTMLANQSGAAG